MDSTIEPKSAALKSATANPGTIFATSQNKNPFIIKVNNPKVRMLIGSVKSINIGFIKILTRPITKAAHNAAINPAKLIPGTIQAVKSKAKAKSIHLINISSIYIPFFVCYCNIQYQCIISFDVSPNSLLFSKILSIALLKPHSKTGEVT